MSKSWWRGIFHQRKQIGPQQSLERTHSLQQAMALHQQGQLVEAETLYRTILKQAPDHFDALHFLGVIEHQRKHYQAAVELIGQALQVNPNHAPAHLHISRALRGLNRHEEALASCDRALAIKPDDAETLSIRANLLHDLKRDEEAVADYDHALAIKPDNAEALNNRGIALRYLKRHEAALASFERALAIRPDYAEALNGRGIALRALNRPEDALASYDKALAIKSDYAEALNNRGNLLHDRNRHEEALASYDRALAITPDYVEALNNRGVALRYLKRHEEALASYDRALTIKPDYAEALNNRGIALHYLKRHEEALAGFEGALAVRPDYAEAMIGRGIALRGLNRHEEALASYDCALAIDPDFADALNNRGTILMEFSRYEEALASYDGALALRPDYLEAVNNRAILLLNLNRYEEAATEFERLLGINPDYDYASGNLLYQRLRCCDWKDYSRTVESIVKDVLAEKRVILPFQFLAAAELPGAQLRCAQIYGKSEHPAAANPFWRGERYDHDRIRVAYLSADYHNHATAYLMAGLFEGHDKARFETTAISFGPDRKDEMRTRLQDLFSRFIDVRRKSDRDTALLLKELEIDIAVDLKGYTEDGRPGILAFRPCPIQVNYLGFPGTMGVEYIDYILADRWVIPEDQHSHYAEKVVYLPDTYQPNDSNRRIGERTPTRLEAGLPATGFVFCSFNNNYKIAPPVFEVWMRLLQRVEGSVLWLLGDNELAVRNLRREAASRGVAPDRLVFAARTALQDHLARHRLADLFLDTLPYNAHTTASDALWAGLAVVTCLGSSFAGRVAGSLLHAVGLPELITENLEDYEALALKLAQNANMLAAIRTKLARNRQNFPLFDTDRFRRNIESAYETMWQRYQRGELTASFAVR